MRLGEKIDDKMLTVAKNWVARAKRELSEAQDYLDTLQRCDAQQDIQMIESNLKEIEARVAWLNKQEIKEIIQRRRV